MIAQNVVILVATKIDRNRKSLVSRNMSIINELWSYGKVGVTNPQSRPPTSKASGIVKTRRVKLKKEWRNLKIHHGACISAQR